MTITMIIITAIIIILSMIKTRKYFDSILNPFMLVGAICFLVQVVGPSYWVLEGKTDYYGIDIMSYMPQAEIIFCIGYMTMWFIFAYSNPSPKKIRGCCYEETTDFVIDFNPMILYILMGLFFVMYSFYIIKKGRSLLSQFTLGQLGTYSEDIVSSEGLTILFFSII